jgi:hypothetical protein
MHSWHRSALSSAITAAVGLVGIVQCSVAVASTFQIIASIPGVKDFEGQFAVDGSGNLYAPVAGESESLGGALYALTVASSYTRAKLLYQFYRSPEGDYPNAVTLTNHYVILGTTQDGGTYNEGTVFNLGTVHKFSPTAVHAFSGGLGAKPLDGAFPENGLTAGPSNRFYGVTLFGGKGADGNYAGDGVLYQVSQSTTDPHYKVLHYFGGPGDGVNPSIGNLVVDAQGNLYGETNRGGANGVGTVFMMRYVNGAWLEQIIYSFLPSNDLQAPTANLVLDAKGNLYGCAQGGTHRQGGIFELMPPAQTGGAWQETVLYNFGDHNGDPVASSSYQEGYEDQGCGITIDLTNNLIVGTSYGGGFHHNSGAIFTVTPPAAGQMKWKETVGHSFNGAVGGMNPISPPLEVGGVYYGGALFTNQVYAFTP